MKCAVLLVMLIASIACAARAENADPEKVREARKFLATMGFTQRFLADRNGYIEFLAKDPKVQEGSKRKLIRELKKIDFEERLAAVVGAYFSKDDLLNINAYVGEGIGKKEVVVMFTLMEMIRNKEIQQGQIAEYWEVFDRALSPDELRTANEFRASVAGKRYWAGLGGINDQMRPVLSDCIQSAIRRAARADSSPPEETEAGENPRPAANHANPASGSPAAGAAGQ